MHWTGVAIGAMAFFVIGIFHPIVIKCEYYFSYKIWPLFLLGGLACCVAALRIEQILISSFLAIFGFSMLWSIHELKEQAERVRKGWFPQNPKRAQGQQKSENAGRGKL
jgi:hypothetical protein